MLIEFVKAWRRLAQGRVIDFHNGAADVLCRRGIARPYQPPPEDPTSKHVARRQKRKASHATDAIS